MFEVTQLAVGGFDDNFSYVVHETESGETFVVDPTGDTGKIRAAGSTGCRRLLTRPRRRCLSGRRRLMRFHLTRT